jgi:hypothetical protein
MQRYLQELVHLLKKLTEGKDPVEPLLPTDELTPDKKFPICGLSHFS